MLFSFLEGTLASKPTLCYIQIDFLLAKFASLIRERHLQDTRTVHNFVINEFDPFLAAGRSPRQL